MKTAAIRPGIKSTEAMETKVFPLFKQLVDREKSTFEGFSAGIGNRDEGDDIILPGAFDKTILQRVAAKKVKYIDQHNYMSTTRLWGSVDSAKEIPVDPRDSAMDVAVKEGASHLLWSRFNVSSVREAQDALIKIEEGHLDGLSIGYHPVEVSYAADTSDGDSDPIWEWLMGRGVRKIHELAWWETSSVIWGMNVAALTIPGTVKALLDFADRATREGLQVDEDKVRKAMTALGKMLKEPADVAEVLHEGPALQQLMQRMDQALLRLDKGKDDALDSRGKLIQLYDVFKAEVGEGASPEAFGSYVQETVAEPVEVTEESPAAEHTEIAALRQELQELKEQLGTFVAGTLLSTEEETATENELDTSASEQTTAPDQSDHAADSNADAEGMDIDVLSLHLAKLNLLQLEMA